MKVLTISLICAVMLAGPLALVTHAKPAYATKEKKACAYCHLKPSGGGARGFRGIYYKAKDLSFKDFNEKKEAELAGVKEGAMGKDSKPTKPYKPTK